MQSLRDISLPAEFENGIFIMGPTVFWFDKMNVSLENGFLVIELKNVPCFFNLKGEVPFHSHIDYLGLTKFRITNLKTRLWVFDKDDCIDTVIAKLIEGRKLTPIARMAVYEIIYSFNEIRRLEKLGLIQD